MTRAVVHVDVHGDHVHVDLRDLAPHLRPLLLAALELDPLEKAGGGEGIDPRFPEVGTVIERVRSTWERWTTRAVDAMARLLGHKGPPPAPRDYDRVFEEFEVGTLAATTGHTADVVVVDRLVASGELPRDYALTAPIPTATRLGLETTPTVPATIPAAPRVPPPVDARVYSEAEVAAIAYTRERAAVFMRRPIGAVRTELMRTALDSGVVTDRRMSEAERAMVGREIERAITDRQTPKETAQRLRDAVKGTALTNDMMRVAVTEVAFAHAHGALAVLKGRIPPGTDPLVYKTASPDACKECRRIWGHPTNPTLYRLSVVEAGNNFGRPAAEWGPTVGPVHPRCLCPPLQLWNAEVHDAVQDVAAELAAVFGGR